MAFTGTILRELARPHMSALGGSSSSNIAGGMPFLDNSSAPQRFLAAQAAALDALASVLARFRFGAAGGAELVVASSVASAASLSAELAASSAAAAASAAAPPSAAVLLVTHSMLNRDMAGPIRNSPSLAIDTWRSLISMLKTAMTNARSVLPYAGGAALAAAAAAIAFHVLTVRLPDWRRTLEGATGRQQQELQQLQQREQAAAAAAAAAANRRDPAAMSISELADEVTALRAEIDAFRVLPVPPNAKPVDLESYADVSEAHIRSLEHQNAILRDNIAELAKELEAKSKDEDRIAVLSSSLADERQSVQNLLWEVESLKVEKESQTRRVVALENSLDELRVMFVGLNEQQKQSRSVSRSSRREESLGSMSRGRRRASGLGVEMETVSLSSPKVDEPELDEKKLGGTGDAGYVRVDSVLGSDAWESV